MLQIKIGNKEYKLEYTIEASLFNECTEKVTNFMMNIGAAEDNNDLKAVLSSMADIPQTALTLFYAGLLEHHGEDGDGTVLSKSDAKKLIKQYISEHSDDETGNFYGVMGMLIEQMGNDGFFGLIGLDKMFAPSKEVKKPQDHKKKQNAKVTEM